MYLLIDQTDIAKLDSRLLQTRPPTQQITPSSIPLCIRARMEYIDIEEKQ